MVAPDAHTRGGDLDTGEGPAPRDRGEVDRCPDTERLGAGEIDAFDFSPEDEARLAGDRKEFIDGLFRVLQEQVEEAKARVARRVSAATAEPKAKAKSKAKAKAKVRPRSR